MRIAQDAGELHEWPPEAGNCSGEEYAIFVKNQEFRAYQDWIAGDLIELARLSKLQAAVIEETESLLFEGVVTMGGKHGNTPVENPRGRAVATLNSTINALMRRLGITVMSVGVKETRATRAQKEREAERNMPGDASERTNKRSLI